MTPFAALLQRDLRVIARDGFLVMMAGYSLLLAAVARIAVRYVPIDHIELYVAPFVIVTACGLIGLVFGFALIRLSPPVRLLSMQNIRGGQSRSG